MRRLALGIDFGTLSARGLLLDADTGEEAASKDCAYPHGILEEKLPDGTELPPDSAIELPEDYVCEDNHCTCGNPASHADPNNIVDACAGYLPEQTFYFFNQNHEKTASNNIIMFLAADILTDDDFTSVHSYPDKYPQFNVERNSKGFMRDIEKMKAYDTSDLSPELQKELADAIDAAEAAINNTNMDPEEFDQAKKDFNLACAKVMNGGTLPETKTDTGIDFDSILVKIFKFISDLFYWLFRGDSIGEIIGWEYLEF